MQAPFVLSGECDGGEFEWVYDAYGNLLDDGTNQYTYDAAMRLTAVTDGASTSTFAYNGDGDRVSQTVDDVTTTYVLDTATPLTMVLVETTGEDSIYYLHGLDLIAQSDGANTEYFAYDGLGSVRQVVDEAAGVLLAQTYDPYGGVYASAGPGETNFGFTGEYTDDSGLIYLRARYYSPGMGRFLSADPSRLEANPYLYAASNPVLYTDPSGDFYALWLLLRLLSCATASPTPDGVPGADRYEFDNWYLVADATDFLAGTGDNGYAIHPSDVRQGFFHNCYFAVVLAEIAFQSLRGRNTIISSAIHRPSVGDGTPRFRVTYYDYQNGYAPGEVWVQPQRPGVMDEIGNPSSNPSLIQPGDIDTGAHLSEQWPLILENAFALYLSRSFSGREDLTTGYQIMAGAGHRGPMQVFSWFTGEESEEIRREQFDQALFRRLAAEYDSGALMIASSLTSDSGSSYYWNGEPEYTPDSGGNRQLWPNHGYYITDIDATNETISVRNPWGWSWGEDTWPFVSFRRLFWRIVVNRGG